MIVGVVDIGGCINFNHPVIFDKLAVDPNQKQAIVGDLDRFMRRKDYCRKVGKARKREATCCTALKGQENRV